MATVALGMVVESLMHMELLLKIELLAGGMKKCMYLWGSKAGSSYGFVVATNS